MPKNQPAPHYCKRLRGLIDEVAAFEVVDCRFESYRGHMSVSPMLHQDEICFAWHIRGHLILVVKRQPCGLRIVDRWLGFGFCLWFRFGGTRIPL